MSVAALKHNVANRPKRVRRAVALGAHDDMSRVVSKIGEEPTMVSVGMPSGTVKTFYASTVPPISPVLTLVRGIWTTFGGGEYDAAKTGGVVGEVMNTPEMLSSDDVIHVGEITSWIVGRCDEVRAWITDSKLRGPEDVLVLFLADIGRHRLARVLRQSDLRESDVEEVALLTGSRIPDLSVG